MLRCVKGKIRPGCEGAKYRSSDLQIVVLSIQGLNQGDEFGLAIGEERTACHGVVHPDSSRGLGGVWISDYNLR